MIWLEPKYVYVDGVLKENTAVLMSATDGTGKIVSVGRRGHDDLASFPLPQSALLPGFVNAHSHAFQRGLRGWAQHSAPGVEDSFWTWREAMYALAHHLDPDAMEAISTLAFAEMLKAGFTTVGEFHYVHHQPDGTPYADRDELAMRVVHAARRVGMRIVLLRVAYGRAGWRQEPNPRQARFIDKHPDLVIASWERLRALGVDVGVAPHSVRACSADWLRTLSRVPSIVHAHVAEQPAEVEQCLAEHHKRPLEVLADAGLLSDRFTAVHLTHPDAAELELLHQSAANVCACPTTELDLGDGFFPAWQVTAPVCLGTDSHASIDPFAEMRGLEWHSRAVLGRRNVTPHAGMDGLAAALIDRGTRNGMRALGLEGGAIQAGGPADMIAIDLRRIEFAASRLLPALVFNGSAAAVTDVWVGGRHVVKEGHIPGGEALALEAERAIRRLAIHA
ncbi:MAG: formimidoylglutamate deiminase [Myxococcales bacterium]|nr:formimidoylglutamate deiminase [Myxococcales bacterium]